jgi:hypothetical protein
VQLGERLPQPAEKGELRVVAPDVGYRRAGCLGLRHLRSDGAQVVAGPKCLHDTRIETRKRERKQQPGGVAGAPCRQTCRRHQQQRRGRQCDRHAERHRRQPGLLRPHARQPQHSHRRRAGAEQQRQRPETARLHRVAQRIERPGAEQRQRRQQRQQVVRLLAADDAKEDERGQHGNHTKAHAGIAAPAQACKPAVQRRPEGPRQRQRRRQLRIPPPRPAVRVAAHQPVGGLVVADGVAVGGPGA